MLSDRMDTGCAYIPLKTEISKLPPITSAKEIIQIIDLYIGHEGSWNTGSHPAQTFLGCLYVEDILTSYVGTENGPFFVHALHSALKARAVQIKEKSEDIVEKKLPQNNGEQKEKKEELNIGISDGPSLPKSTFSELEPQQLLKYQVEVEKFLTSLPLYPLLALGYFIGAIKTADVCTKQYYMAKNYIYQDEDIGLNTFDFRLLDDVSTTVVHDILMQCYNILDFEREREISRSPISQKSSEQQNNNSKSSKNNKGKSKVKGKGKSGKSKPQPQQTPNNKVINKPKTEVEIIELAMIRFKMRSGILQTLDKLPILETSEKINNLVSTITEILMDIPPRSEKFSKAFSSGIQSRGSNNNPFRDLNPLSIDDGYSTWRSIFLTINDFHQLQNVTNKPLGGGVESGNRIESAGGLRAFFMSFGGSKPTAPISSGPAAGEYTQALPLARAVLCNIAFQPDRVEILGKSAIEWALSDMNELCATPYMRILLSNSRTILGFSNPSVVPFPSDLTPSSPVNAIEKSRQLIDSFCEEAGRCYFELLASFVCNRSRQRQMLSHAIVTWDSLEVSAQTLDEAVYQELTEQNEPIELYYLRQEIPDQMTELTGISKPMKETQRAFPLVWWVSIRRMLTIECVILMGFELEIYKPWEYAYMYNYAEEVCTEILGYLKASEMYVLDALEFRKRFKEQSKLLKSKINNQPLYPGDQYSLVEDVEKSNSYIQSLEFEQQMIKELCEGQKLLSEAAILLGYISRPASLTKHTPARLLYLLRMKPFSSVGYPIPPELDFGPEEEYEKLQNQNKEEGKKEGTISSNPPKQVLFREDPNEIHIPTQTRISSRLSFTKQTSILLSRKLGVLAPSLKNSSTNSSHNRGGNSNTGVGSSAATELANLKASAESLGASADRLEKQVKMGTAGSISRRKIKVDIKAKGNHPWFPILEFERERK